MIQKVIWQPLIRSSCSKEDLEGKRELFRLFGKRIADKVWNYSGKEFGKRYGQSKGYRLLVSRKKVENVQQKLSILYFVGGIYSQSSVSQNALRS